jgi:hypothetical protein
LSQTNLGVQRRPLNDATAASSGNFRFDTPVVRLPGRGLDVALDLTYNGKLWNAGEAEVIFDINAAWPVPGWSLGFGKLVVFSGTTSEVSVRYCTD